MKVVRQSAASVATDSVFDWNVSGLKFDFDYIVVRVRARNKTAAGEYSEPVTLETKGKHMWINELMKVISEVDHLNLHVTITTGRWLDQCCRWLK